MKEDTKQDTRNTAPGDDPTDTVAKLMSLAGPRADIEKDLQSRVHDRVRQEWLRSTRKKKIIRWAVPLGVAATVVLAVGVGMRSPVPVLPPQQVGTIAYITGNSNTGQTPYSVGDAVHTGDLIKTGSESGLSVALQGDVSLRINAGTSIRFDAANDFSLDYGQVYADSGDRIYPGRHITIHTDGGSATDIGTQFSVSYSDEQLNVAVREGRVDVANSQGTFTAEAGDTLTIAGGDVVTGKVSPYDASWRWASALSPGFVLENETLMDFLKWAARETGKELVFSSDELRMAAMGTKLFGSVDGFTPIEAIESVLSTTRFHYRVDLQSITILN
jgi:ferric-dicitrate binding protein FerR (iron transport regulator)